MKGVFHNGQKSAAAQVGQKDLQWKIFLRNIPSLKDNSSIDTDRKTEDFCFLSS